MKNVTCLSVLIWANKARMAPDGLVPLYARITCLGKRSEVSINVKVDIKKWNARLGLMSDNSGDSKKINAQIGSVRKEIEKAYDILANTNAFVSAESIKSKYLGEERAQRKLLEVFAEHNTRVKELIGKGIVKATFTKYETIKGKVEDFIKHNFKANDLYLANLEFTFITEFEHYLKVDQSISHNVVMSYIKRVKRIVRIAYQNKWIDHNPFEAFVCTTKKTLRTELEAEELTAIEEKVFTTQRLKEIADCYLFSCYTGYAFVDASKLTPGHIVQGSDGEMWIKTERTKSKIEANVPLISNALAIIERYKDHPSCVYNNRLLPMRSNQKMNEYLKEIAGICGIKKNLTTHTARHTFATTVTLENGVPIESVSKMLGHTKITTTQIYSRVKEKKVSSDMKELKKKQLQIAIQGSPIIEAIKLPSQIGDTNYPLMALRDTENFIAPMLNEKTDFKGMKLLISWASYRKYYEYRNSFTSVYEFLEIGKPFLLSINILFSGNATGLLEILNDSIYFMERKMTVEIIHYKIDDGLNHWVTI
ncbi:site-specific integrase [Mucilaginibacter phyllosphaerae]